MSPSTAAEDLGRKKGLYERTFHTPGYFAYDPDADRLFGWRLLDTSVYAADAQRRRPPMECPWRRGSAHWSGDCGQTAVWLRLFDSDGRLLPTQGEAGAQRVAELEAENERLRAELSRREGH